MKIAPLICVRLAQRAHLNSSLTVPVRTYRFFDSWGSKDGIGAMTREPLKHGSLRRFDIRPPFRDGLASRFHVGEHADGGARRRVKLPCESVERHANRLVRLCSFFGVIFFQDTERSSGLKSTNCGRKRFAFRVAKHEGAATLFVASVNSPQQQMRREAHLHAVDFERGESLAGKQWWPLLR